MKMVDKVEATALFRTLAAAHPKVEVWLDEGYSEEGWAYSWIICRPDEFTVKNLAYVRWKTGQFQQRKYDQNGDDLWIDAD
jgi:hypothetical protein